MLGLILPILMFINVHAQETAMLNPGTTGEVSKAPAGANTELQVTLKNTAATNIYVFAGPKEEIRTPRVVTYGGYSKNTIYVKLNDVVCLMNAEVKPTACTVIKPGVNTVEVNSGGNGISSK